MREPLDLARGVYRHALGVLGIVGTIHLVERDDSDPAATAVRQVGVVIVAAPVGIHGVVDPRGDSGIEILAGDPFLGRGIDHVTVVVAGANEGGDEVRVEVMGGKGAQIGQGRLSGCLRRVRYEVARGDHRIHFDRRPVDKVDSLDQILRTAPRIVARPTREVRVGNVHQDKPIFSHQIRRYTQKEPRAIAPIQFVRVARWCLFRFFLAARGEPCQ